MEQRVSSSYNYVNISSSSLQKGELTAYNKKFSYDHSGRLIREVSTEYFTESASETIELIFLYDESGMIGFMHSRNGSTPQAYYYQRNLLGDVVAIYNTSGTKVASYTYDAWGNCTATGSMAPINPIRYRGYYWDSETGWYYLNARYYSPEWRRFISPDNTSYLDPKSVNGLNLYCYCNNDPVNYCDPSGHFSFWILAISIGVNLIFEAIDDYSNGGFGDGSHDWRDYLGAGISGVFGSFSGGPASSIAFAIAGGLADAAISGDLEEDGFWNTIGSIAFSSVISMGIGHSTQRIASGIKASSLKKIANNFGNNVANRQLRAMGTTIKMGSNAIKYARTPLSKVIYGSQWIVKDIYGTLTSSIVGGVLSL